MISHSKRAKFELAEILKIYGSEFRSSYPISYQQEKTLQAIEACRTNKLGGHVDGCTSCGHVRISYNSCRNRHCPKCQNTHREKWILARREELLDVPCFHVVFTIPEALNGYCLALPRQMYDILFRASRDTLFAMGKDAKHLGADMGCISILHTWGQNLMLHPHIHMIVPAGGVDKKGRWKATRSNGNFLFPVKAMSIVFKHKFMEQFVQLCKDRKIHLSPLMKQSLYGRNWVVYAKQPFAGPDQVIEYLGRYSHKIAMSNHRIQSIATGVIQFQYKDYRMGGKRATMSLQASEFLRRLCMHILPHGFMKIRHYGILSNRNKIKIRKIQLIRGILPRQKNKMNYQDFCKTIFQFDPDQCPCCKTGRMITLLHFAAHAPPIDLISFKNKLQTLISQMS